MSNSQKFKKIMITEQTSETEEGVHTIILNVAVTINVWTYVPVRGHLLDNLSCPICRFHFRRVRGRFLGVCFPSDSGSEQKRKKFLHVLREKKTGDSLDEM